MRRLSGGVRIGSLVLVGTLVAAVLVIFGAKASVDESNRRVSDAKEQSEIANRKKNESELIAADAAKQTRDSEEQRKKTAVALKIAKDETEKAKIEKAKADSGKAKADLEVERAKAELEDLLQESAEKVAAAQVKVENAALQARQAETNRSQALKERQIALVASRYERESFYLEQRYKLAVLENLVKVMEPARWLQQVVQDGRPLKDYPAFSPLVVLRAILDSNPHQRNQLELPAARILSASYSPDQKYIATGNDVGSIHLWTASGQQLNHWDASSAPVLGVSFSPDLLHLASASVDGKIEIWDLQGNLIREWKAYTSAARGVSFSPDGQTLATGGQDGVVKIWTLSGEKLHEWQAHPSGGIFEYDVIPIGVSVSFNPQDRNQLATAAQTDNKVKLWNVSGEPLSEFSVPREESLVGVYSVSFSPDGKHLATAEQGGVIRDLSGKKLSQQYRSPANNTLMWDISFSPDGKRFVTTFLYGGASVWDLQETPSEPEQSWQAVDYPAGFWHVYFSPDKRHIVTVRWDDPRVAKIWDLSSLTKPIAVFEKIRVIKFDPQGQFFIVEDDGFVHLWNASDPQQSTNQLALQGSIKYIDLSSDGQILITAGEDNTIRLWRMSGRNISQKLLEWHIDGSVPVPFISPNGQYIVLLGRTLQVWNLKREKLAEWRPLLTVRSLSFSPDSKLIATAGDDYVAPVRVWDMLGKEQLQIIPSAQNRVEQVSFSPDGQLFATAGIDGTSQLWTLSGQRIAQFAPYGVSLNERGAWIRSVSFSSDSKLLATADSSGKVRLWKVQGIDELLDRGCAWLKEYLTSHPDAPKVCPYQQYPHRHR